MGVKRSVIRNSLGAPTADGKFQVGDKQFTIDVYVCPARDSTATIVLVGY
jgi:hypothetical protein